MTSNPVTLKEVSSVEIIYRPESPIRQPGRLLQSMFEDLRRSQYVAWRIFLRDVNARYRQTFLGFFWAFIPPIVVAIAFTWAGQAKVVSVGETNLPYTAYVMLSMVLWQTFSESVAGPVQAVGDAKIMLARINFPREAIVVAKIWEVLFSFVIKLILVAALFLWFRIPLDWSIALAPLALLMLMGFGFAVGLLLAPLAALYQDISKGLTIVLGGWLFLTPVVYPLPTGDGIAATIIRANPVTVLLVTTRDLATGQHPSLLPEFYVASFSILIFLGITWVVYRLAIPFVIERLSA